MENKDKLQFSKQLSAIGTVFDRKNLSSELLEIYFQALKSLTMEEFKQSIGKCMATLKFFPKPAEILEAAHGDPRARGLAAWNLLKENSDAYSSYQFPKPIMVAIERTFRDIQGFQNAARDDDSYTWNRKQDQFIEHFEAAVMGGTEPHRTFFSGIFNSPEVKRISESGEVVKVPRKELSSSQNSAAELLEKIGNFSRRLEA